MSSEGSVSSNGSRIRQFGLYRSIDARTEEFLRLSRRRQIRQGCACAAVSTAITVTIFVVVIFVYEFSLNSEVNIETSLKSNWFSLINDTTENGFKSKLTKSGIDKTTLTLLPILLKALKKDVFLENFLEEQSSSSPSYEEKETTEYGIEKNVFTRNWFRIPSSKVYAVAYKISPLSYYKITSKNLEYFTKIRKIRDYQRMINYMDKMISEKVYIGSTKPMVKKETTTEKLLTTTVLKKVLVTDFISEYHSKTLPLRPKTIVVNEKNAENSDKTIKCKCSLKVGDVLHKILLGIEKLLSINMNSGNSTMSDCHHHKTFKKLNKILDEKMTDTGFMENETSTAETLNTTSKEDNHKNIQMKAHQRQNITKTIEQVSQRYNQGNNDVNSFDSSTPLLKDQLDVTDNIPKTVTQPMKSANKYKNFILQDQNTVFNLFAKHGQKLDQYKSDTSSVNKNRYNDHLIVPAAIDSLLDLNEFELMNERIFQTERPQKSTSAYKIYKAFKPASYKKPFVASSNDLFKNNWIKNLNKSIYQMIERDKNIQIKPMPTESNTKSSTRRTTKPTHLTDLNTTVTTQLKKELTKNKKKNLPKLIVEETENQSSLTQEDMLNPIESSKSTSAETNISAAQVFWEELKNLDGIPAWKSMIPNHRPIYLEIQQKNDWKHEEQDYDFNILDTYDNIPEET